MFKLLIAACLVAVAASQYTECGDMQRLKVMKQWVEAFGFTKEREELSSGLWREIIGKRPEVVERYFSKVRGDNIYSGDFLAHSARVMSGFDMTLSLLDDKDAFAAQIAHLNAQHIDLDVDGIYFDDFRIALMNAVQRKIGICFDYDAWAVCSSLIEDGIKHNK